MAILFVSTVLLASPVLAGWCHMSQETSDGRVDACAKLTSCLPRRGKGDQSLVDWWMRRYYGLLYALSLFLAMRHAFNYYPAITLVRTFVPPPYRRFDRFVHPIVEPQNAIVFGPSRTPVPTCLGGCASFFLR